MKSMDEPCSVSQVEAVGADSVVQMACVVRERLYPFVAGAVRDCHAAEDILQDIMCVLLERVHLLRRSESFWPWVYRVAWSRVQDHFRERGRLRRMSDAALLFDPACCGRETAADPLDTILRREAVEQLTVAMEQLNPRCRTVLYLRFHEQMSCTRIACLLDSTPGQIRIQIHRAKRVLRDSLLLSCA